MSADVTEQTSPSEDDLVRLAAAWRSAQAEAAGARDQLVLACRRAKAAGMSAYRIRLATGAAEPTIRRWLQGEQEGEQ